METPITPQPVQTPTPVPVIPPMMPAPVQPKPARWLWTVVLPAIILIGAYFIAAQRIGMWPFIPAEVVVTPFPSPSATPDVTANWKTYTNTEYGYELKYPVAYEVRTQIGNPQIFFPETELITGEFASSFESQRVTITVGKQTSLSLQEWVRQKWPVADGRTQITQNITALINGGTNTTINGHAALQIDLGEEKYAFIDNGNKQVVRIFCWAQPSCPQILSTFKFTK